MNLAEGRIRLGAVRTMDSQAQNKALHELHPAWVNFIRYCEEMGFGVVEELKIQDGLPMSAVATRKKVKFVP